MQNIELNHDTPSYEVYTVKNADGSDRWIFPTSSKKPLCLLFYNPTNWKQRCFVLFMKCIFFLRLQHLCFTKRRYTLDHSYRLTADWALFTGTPGPNRKQLLVDADGRITKIARTSKASEHIQQEAKILSMLAQKDTTFSIPEILDKDADRLQLTLLPKSNITSQLTHAHGLAIEDISTIHRVQKPLGDSVFFTNMSNRIHELLANENAKWDRGLLVQIKEWVDRLDTSSIVKFSMAHGDFTPWNTFFKAPDQLAVIDWELAQIEKPLGYDFFHYLFQSGILLHKKSWSQIYQEVHSTATNRLRDAALGRKDFLDQYFQLYLLDHITYYLSVYQEQKVWHRQVYWQLAVWKEAVQTFLPSGSARKHFIKDLFLYMSDKNYAVLKLEEQDPVTISIFSDLDILIEKADLPHLINWISTKKLDHVNVVRKSFMLVVEISFPNADLLHLDFIWEFRRKHLVYLEAKQLLDRAIFNQYGVRVTTQADNDIYRQLFQFLNGKKVALNPAARFAWQQYLHSAHNSLLKKSINMGHYIIDSLKQSLLGSGFVITFSGVDGAGKTTVISELSQIIDKQFRRPVKLLRHRPSVLPIISAWFFGKAAAEQRSVSQLPRQGNNNSILSSAVRFSYYYLDYLFGQFYIYGKYIMRGYVVIYDRYYYDFMVDGKRSNITLPSWITRWGKKGVLTPRFNFFLYAPAATILERKKELPGPAIQELTHAYKSLFTDMAERHPDQVFDSIQNIDLPQTLSGISRILQKQF